MKSLSLKAVLLLSSALGVGPVAAHAGAIEQSAPAQASSAAAGADQATQVEEVLVTGSRIRQPNLASTSPIQSLGEAAIQRTGAVQASDVINELPQFGSGFGSSSQSLDSANTGFSSGVELVNLRGLGAKRTLVLVNGRRYVGGDPGTSSVDLSSIPTDMIQRLDVVTGAASAVYGADAVSGVVNIVFRDKFDGLKLTARTGVSDRDDAEEYSASLLFGRSFADGRGRFLVASEYSDTKGFLASDRAYGQFDAANFTVSPLNGSSASAGGRVSAGAVQYVFDSANNPVLASTIPLQDRLFQRLPLRTQMAPVEKFNVSLSSHYDLVPKGDGFSASAYLEGAYSKVDSSIQYEPMSLFFDGTKVGTPAEGPNDAPRIPVNNPFLIRFANQVGVAPASITAVNRRLSETGVRFTNTRRETYRVAAGVEGALNDRFDYDVYYQYGQVDSEQDDTGALDRNRLFAGLFVNDNGTPGNLADDRCADAAYVALGCTPLNVFGAGTVSKAYLDYAGIRSHSETQSKQHVVSGYVTGPLFSLPAGAVTLVLGGEYRKEHTVITPAASYLDKSSSTRFLNGARGGYDVLEEFAELQLPLLADLPLAHSLILGGAVRHSNYSTVGSKFSYSGKIDWAVNDALRLRGVYSTAVRAPNINELYAPLSSVNSSIFDPCDRVSDTGGAIALTGNRAANCAAALGANFANFDQTQSQRGTVQAQSMGDPNLDAEQAKTFTAGFVLTPRTWLRGASLSVDYYDIKIDKVISDLGLQDVVNQCYDQPNLPPLFCGNVTRSAATGQLFSVRNQLFNAATETVRGVDVQAGYGFDLQDVVGGLRGNLGLTASWSRLLEHDFLSREGANVDHRRGQVGDFRSRVNLGALYRWNAFRVSVDRRYLSAVVADTTIASTSALFAANHLPSRAYTDLQVGYAFRERYDVTFGVKNLGDTDPPINTTPSRTVVNGSSVSGNVYDVRGRFFYLSVSATF